MVSGWWGGLGWVGWGGSGWIAGGWVGLFGLSAGFPGSWGSAGVFGLSSGFPGSWGFLWFSGGVRAWAWAFGFGPRPGPWVSRVFFLTGSLGSGYRVVARQRLALQSLFCGGGFFLPCLEFFFSGVPRTQTRWFFFSARALRWRWCFSACVRLFVFFNKKLNRRPLVGDKNTHFFSLVHL